MVDYITLAHVKTVGRITTTADDSLLTILITRASRMIDDLCGRHFYALTDARTYDAVGGHISGQLLFLDADLLTLSGIVNGDGTVLTNSDVLLRPLNMPPYFGIAIKHETGQTWTYDDDPAGAITVSGEWGYSDTPPEPIEHAVTRLTLWLYRQRAAGLEVLGAKSQDAAAYIPRDILLLLRRYRRTSVWGAA